jgi:hypothetical protein
MKKSDLKHKLDFSYKLIKYAFMAGILLGGIGRHIGPAVLRFLISL